MGISFQDFGEKRERKKDKNGNSYTIKKLSSFTELVS